jgi:ABC-type sugar transport system substrate-binding protein
MRSARALSLVATAVLALLVAACGSSSDSGGSSTSGNGGGGGKKPRIAYLTYSDTDFVQAETKGFKEVAQKDGGSVTVFSANFDPQQQIKQCADAVTSGRYNAIIIGTVDSSAGVPCVRQAKAAGIPVGTIEAAVGKDPLNIRPQTDGVVATMINSFTTNAQGEADMVKKACGDRNPCKVIGEVATPSDRFTNMAIDAIKTAGPNIRLVQKISGQYDPSVIAKALPDALSAHPDADVFAAATDSSVIAVLPAIKSAGRFGKIRLLGNGGSRQGVAAVAAGTMFSTMANSPYTTAKMLATSVIQAVNGQRVTAPSTDALTVPKPFILYKDNASQFTPEWGAK